MKATTKYNDLIGTSAADISDNISFKDFLASRNVDTDRFEAIGAKFFSGYNNYFSVYIICIDKAKSTEKNKHIVELTFEENFGLNEFFNLFKRFEVVVSQKFSNYQEEKIEESIRIRENGEIEE